MRKTCTTIVVLFSLFTLSYAGLPSGSPKDSVAKTSEIHVLADFEPIVPKRTTAKAVYYPEDGIRVTFFGPTDPWMVSICDENDNVLIQRAERGKTRFMRLNSSPLTPGNTYTVTIQSSGGETIEQELVIK